MTSLETEANVRNKKFGTKPRNLRVWVDQWQMECCGEPIQVGGEARWTLQEALSDSFANDVLGDTLAASITHAEEHHDDLIKIPVTVGIITAIKAVYVKFAQPDPMVNTWYPVRGSSVLCELAEADGSEDHKDGFSLVSYLVDLNA